MAVVEVPNHFPITIQRHRREHQRRLDACNCVRSIRGPASQQPRREKLARAEGEEVPYHHREDGCLDADVPMGIQQVGRGAALLCHGGEGHHAVNETHHHPVDRVLRRRRAGVPPKERQARDPDEEPEVEEVKAEFGFVDAPVTPSGEFGGAIGKKGHDGEAHEGPDRR